ncbi:MAG: hypothetical protein J5936_03880 [Acholeplasmatales bacterium]|nr:hypothetical protein [Acholeplasmatales bacterium]
MKKISKLLGLLFIMISFITLASCSGGAGVKAIMEGKPTSNKVTITCTFEANSKLETGDAYPIIRKYSYENGEPKDTSDDYKKVTFDKSNTVASVEFDGLDSNTKYLFKMYINYESTDTYITEIEVTTLSYDDEKPIEITSKEEFKKMTDDNDGIYILKNDIDFDGEELSLFESEDKAFNGTFNGDGHKISNVKLSTTSLSYYGLFGYTKSAKISNLTLENVTVESNGLGTFSAGSLIGCAESTIVSNVTIKNVNYSVTVSSSGDVNIGGVVGSADKSTFTNTQITDATINFTQARYKVNVGLFAGKVSGNSVGTKTIDGKEKKIVTDECSAAGSITGVMKFTSSTEGYFRAGGFVGFVEGSSSIIYNSYCNGKIELTKTDSTDKFDLSVGGFLGSNSGFVNISKCFAKTDLSVKAASDEDRLVANESDKTAAIGGFAGRLNRTIGKISDCYFTGNVEVVAKDTRKASSSERTLIETEKNDKISNMAVGTVVTVNGIEYEIASETIYYTIEATAATVADQTELEAGTYYLVSGDDYNLATEYDSAATYYTLAVTVADVNEDTKFGSTPYYTLSEDNYSKASSYTPKEVEATYLFVGEMVGYTNYDDLSTLTNISNVAKFEPTSDKDVFETFVKNFVNTIN